jgi:hypothetical protein
VSLPPGAGIITASASFTVTVGLAAGLLPANLPLLDGAKPERVEVVAQTDGTTKMYLIGRSGTRFEWGRTATR